jgi:hypothetical protein
VKKSIICLFLLFIVPVAFGYTCDWESGVLDTHHWSFHCWHIAARQKILEQRSALAELSARVARLEGLPGQLQDARNNIAAVKSTTEQYRTETNKIKEETITITKLSDVKVASASENIELLKREVEKSKAALEDYKKQIDESEKDRRLYEQRQERLYEAFSDIFDTGNIEDLGMAEAFAKASEFSPEFKTLFEELKTVPDVRRLFKQKAYRLKTLFFAILKEHKELEPLVDQPAQLAITGEFGKASLGYRDGGEL